MTLLRDISLIYSFLFTLPLFIALFESRLSPKKTMALLFGFSSILLAITAVQLAQFGPQKVGTLVLLTCTLPSMIFFWFVSKQRDGRFFFTFCLADTLIGWLISVTSLIDFFLGNTYIVMSVSRFILCPLLAWIINKWVRPAYREVQNKVTSGWGSFAVIALIFYLILCLSFSVPTLITQRLEQLPAFCLLLVLMPVLYFYIFKTLHVQQQVYEAEQTESILQLQAANMTARIEEYSAAMELSRQERHDFRHMLQTLSVLAQKGQYEELNHMIEDYCDTPQQHDTRSYCVHPVIDAALAAYLQQAERKGIRVSTRLSFPNPLPVSETELATVFANAIENAIHACESVELPKRSIEIQVLSHPCFMLQIRNSFDGRTAFDEQGIPITPKQGHGFGARSIVTFCKKNDAFYEFKADDQSFEVCIIFQ